MRHRHLTDKPKRREASARVAGTDEARKGKKMEITYDLTIRFTASRELTEDELDALKLQTIAQIEEPVDGEGDEVEYTTELCNSSIDRVATEEDKARAAREFASGICEGCSQPLRDCLCD